MPDGLPEPSNDWCGQHTAPVAQYYSAVYTNLVADRIGPQHSPLIRLSFEHVDDKQICVADVNKSSDPVFVEAARGREFYVRVGNTSRSLDPEETINYIDSHFRGA